MFTFGRERYARRSSITTVSIEAASIIEFSAVIAFLCFLVSFHLTTSIICSNPSLRDRLSITIAVNLPILLITVAGLAAVFIYSHNICHTPY